MAKHARSARGDIVDFDLLAIKDQLASRPVPVGVDKRRKFIDEKDGLKPRRDSLQPEPSMVDMLAVATASAQESNDSSSQD
jgi:hypothetical protein